MGATILTVSNLELYRGRRKVLDIEEFKLAEGEIVALVGPNGAGKSTLLQVLALLLKPSRGTITYKGETVTSRNALMVRRQMAMVMQEPLLLNTTVWANVALGLKLRGCNRNEVEKRVTFWLERLQIAHLAGRRAYSLSGGEARRVSLARALVLEPQVLFLDEPFAALDAATRLSLLQEIKDILRSTNTSTIFVTHDLTEVPCLTDRLVILKEGRIVRSGSFEQIFNVKLKEITSIHSYLRALVI